MFVSYQNIKKTDLINMRMCLKLSIIYYKNVQVCLYECMYSAEDHVQNDDHGDQPENTMQKDQKFIQTRKN